MPPKRKPTVKDEDIAQPSVEPSMPSSSYNTNGRTLRARAARPSASTEPSLAPSIAPMSAPKRTRGKATTGKSAEGTSTKGKTTGAKVTKPKKAATKKTTSKIDALKDPETTIAAVESNGWNSFKPLSTRDSTSIPDHDANTDAASAPIAVPASVRKTRASVKQGKASPIRSPRDLPKVTRRTRKTTALFTNIDADEQVQEGAGNAQEEPPIAALPTNTSADIEMSDTNTATDERPTPSREQTTDSAPQDTEEEEMAEAEDEPQHLTVEDLEEMAEVEDEPQYLTVEDLEEMEGVEETSGDDMAAYFEDHSEADQELVVPGVEYEPQAEVEAQAEVAEPHVEPDQLVSHETVPAETEDELIDPELEAYATDLVDEILARSTTPREATPVVNAGEAATPVQDEGDGSDSASDSDTDSDDDPANAVIVDNWPYYATVNGRAYAYRDWWAQRESIYNTNAAAEDKAPAAITPSRIRYKHGVGALGASPAAIHPATTASRSAASSPRPAATSSQSTLPKHIQRLRASRVRPLVEQHVEQQVEQTAETAEQPVTPQEPLRAEPADGGRTFGLKSLFRSVIPTWLTSQLGASTKTDANAVSPSEAAKARKEDAPAVTQTSPSAGKKASAKKVNRPSRDDRSRSPRRRDEPERRADRRERDYARRSRAEPQDTRGRKKAETSSGTDKKAAAEKPAPAVKKSAEPRGRSGKPARPVNRPTRDDRSRSPRRGQESERGDRRERDYNNGSVPGARAKKAKRPSPDRIPAHRPGERGYGLVEEYFQLSDSDEDMIDAAVSESPKPALSKKTAASTPPSAAPRLDASRTAGATSYSLHGDMTIGQRRRIHRPSRSERRYRVQHGQDDPAIQHRSTVRALYFDPFGTSPLGESRTSYNRMHHLKRVHDENPCVYTGSMLAAPGDVGYREINMFREHARRDRKILRRQAEAVAKKPHKEWSMEDRHVLAEGQRRLGHVAGTGTFTVPEYDTDEEDSSLLEDEPVSPTPTPKTSEPAKETEPARPRNMFAAAAAMGQTVPSPPTALASQSPPPADAATESRPPRQSAPAGKSPSQASAPAVQPSPTASAPASQPTSRTMNIFAAAALQAAGQTPPSTTTPHTQPPPPPTPAHAQLPATPQLPERDTVAMEKAALERARAKLAKHKPTNPSRLQNESRLSASPATSPRKLAAKGPMADSLLTKPKTSAPLSRRRYSNPDIDAMDERVARAIYEAIEQHMARTRTKRYGTEDQRFEDYCIAVEAREQRLGRGQSRAVQLAVDEAKKAFISWDKLVQHERALGASSGV